MQHPPRVESIPCPTCHALELKLQEDGRGAECAACGQLVIFDEEPVDAGKRRNYTPDRGIKKAIGGFSSPMPSRASSRPIPRLPPLSEEISPLENSSTADRPIAPKGKMEHPKSLPAPHPIANGPHDHFGPMPVLHDRDEEKPVVLPSLALEKATRAGCFRRFVVLAVLALIGAATFWTVRYHQRSLAAASAEIPKEVPGHPILSNASDPSGADAEVLEAREFVLKKILPAPTWQELLPHVRLPETTEPLMRAYYANSPFTSLAGVKIGGSKMVENSAGRFAVFLLSSKEFPFAMVEIGADGPKLDWEMLVNYPLQDWRRFIKNRPSDPEELAVTITRCYVREDYLTPEEKRMPVRLIGVRLEMPGDKVQLFAAIDLESDIGAWISTNVPWEHENKITLVRMGLAFNPKHLTFGQRVSIDGQPRAGWNRPKPRETRAAIPEAFTE